jgi:hypothetical protein
VRSSDAKIGFVTTYVQLVTVIRHVLMEEMKTNCRSMTHACVSPLNYAVICLPFKRVNDKTIDCLGASDEQHHCRSTHPSNEISHRFRCSKDDRCLQSSHLCNKKTECSFGADEEFCKIINSHVTKVQCPIVVKLKRFFVGCMRMKMTEFNIFRIYFVQLSCISRKYLSACYCSRELIVRN